MDRGEDMQTISSYVKELVSNQRNLKLQELIKEVKSLPGEKMVVSYNDGLHILELKESKDCVSNISTELRSKLREFNIKVYSLSGFSDIQAYIDMIDNSFLNDKMGV